MDNGRILFFDTLPTSAKIEYFSELFRKIAYIIVLSHLCSLIYGDIEYLCRLLLVRAQELANCQQLKHLARCPATSRQTC